MPGTDEDDMAFAECAFHQAGCGMLCEACDLHLTRPFLGHKVDEEFLPQIERYYRDLAEYERVRAEKQAERENVELTLGAGI